MKNIVILSGKGGVGKSTIAWNIALALSEQGLKTAIFDADMDCPNIPQICGLSNTTKIEVDFDHDLFYPMTHKGVQLMSVGFGIPEKAPILWTGKAKYQILLDFLGATKFDNIDYLIIDCPAGTGDALQAVMQGKPYPIDSAIVVTTPHEAAIADARRAIGMLREQGVNYSGLIVNMASIQCPNCRHSVSVPTAIYDEFIEKEIILKMPFDDLVRQTNLFLNRHELAAAVLSHLDVNLNKKSRLKQAKISMLAAAIDKLA